MNTGAARQSSGARGGSGSARAERQALTLANQDGAHNQTVNTQHTSHDNWNDVTDDQVRAAGARNAGGGVRPGKLSRRETAAKAKMKGGMPRRPITRFAGARRARTEAHPWTQCQHQTWQCRTQRRGLHGAREQHEKGGKAFKRLGRRVAMRGKQRHALAKTRAAATPMKPKNGADSGQAGLLYEAMADGCKRDTPRQIGEPTRNAGFKRERSSVRRRAASIQRECRGSSANRGGARRAARRKHAQTATAGTHANEGLGKSLAQTRCCRWLAYSVGCLRSTGLPGRPWSSADHTHARWRDGR